MISLTNEENRSYKQQEAYHICKEKFCMDEDDEIMKIENMLKIPVITQGNLEELLTAVAI